MIATTLTLDWGSVPEWIAAVMLTVIVFWRRRVGPNG